MRGRRHGLPRHPDRSPEARTPRASSRTRPQTGPFRRRGYVEALTPSGTVRRFRGVAGRERTSSISTLRARGKNLPRDHLQTNHTADTAPLRRERGGWMVESYNVDLLDL